MDDVVCLAVVALPKKHAMKNVCSGVHDGVPAPRGGSSILWGACFRIYASHLHVCGRHDALFLGALIGNYGIRSRYYGDRIYMNQTPRLFRMDVLRSAYLPDRDDEVGFLGVRSILSAWYKDLSTGYLTQWKNKAPMNFPHTR